MVEEFDLPLEIIDRKVRAPPQLPSARTCPAHSADPARARC
jgi:hypothetical protein